MVKRESPRITNLIFRFIHLINYKLEYKNMENTYMNFQIIEKKNTYVLVSFSNGERPSYIPLEQLKKFKNETFIFLQNIPSEKKVWELTYNWVEKNHPQLLI